MITFQSFESSTSIVSIFKFQSIVFLFLCIRFWCTFCNAGDFHIIFTYTFFYALNFSKSFHVSRTTHAMLLCAMYSIEQRSTKMKHTHFKSRGRNEYSLRFNSKDISNMQRFPFKWNEFHHIYNGESASHFYFLLLLLHLRLFHVPTLLLFFIYSTINYTYPHSLYVSSKTVVWNAQFFVFMWHWLRGKEKSYRKIISISHEERMKRWKKR